uniref:Core-binding (CB) domain-containing protein n=1 Tax=Amphimedon queenslandica TaxID=400682 RepID=A0A1X7UZ45_AMPQE
MLVKDFQDKLQTSSCPLGTQDLTIIDSFCRKYISCCNEWQADPISGPIEDIVNFLAQLYMEGYQNKSLNAYRSAVSSMHRRAIYWLAPTGV